MTTDMGMKQNATVARFLDLGQRLFSLFLARALPAISPDRCAIGLAHRATSFSE